MLSLLNSTTLDCNRKFVDCFRSGRVVRRFFDQICLENGLSIIENPKPSRGHYGTWLGDNKPPSWREKLVQLIDTALTQKPTDFENFIKLMEATGCEVKREKYVSLRMNGQNNFIRLRSLPEDYSEDAIKERISGKRTITPKREALQNRQSPQAVKVNLLIDLQNSIKA
ncbi:relaxase/mobilization nuclease domain-containing protein [Lachnospiraceae bacterium ZAX-1]